MTLEECLQYGFLTGSRAMGNARQDSDYDVVVPINYKDKIHDQLSQVKTSEYFNGFTFDSSDNPSKLINIIPVHPHEFLPWFLATKAMAATILISGLTDRIQIHAVFFGIVQYFKATVKQRGTLKEYDNQNHQLFGK